MHGTLVLHKSTLKLAKNKFKLQFLRVVTALVILRINWLKINTFGLQFFKGSHHRGKPTHRKITLSLNANDEFKAYEYNFMRISWP